MQFRASSRGGKVLSLSFTFPRKSEAARFFTRLKFMSFDVTTNQPSVDSVDLSQEETTSASDEYEASHVLVRSQWNLWAWPYKGSLQKIASLRLCPNLKTPTHCLGLWQYFGGFPVEILCQVVLERRVVFLSRRLPDMELKELKIENLEVDLEDIVNSDH